MKATVDVPDQLYRQVKARAALDGRSIRDVTIELYEQWLAEDPTVSGPTQDRQAAAAAWLKSWEELGAMIAGKAVDPRSTRRILLDDRR